MNRLANWYRSLCYQYNPRLLDEELIKLQSSLLERQRLHITTLLDTIEEKDRLINISVEKL